MKIEEVVGLADLGGGMTLKRQTGIGFRHSLSIIYHQYTCTSGIDYSHINTCGTCINRILHQLLDDRGRTLYHLSCSYLVGYRIG